MDEPAAQVDVPASTPSLYVESGVRDEVDKLVRNLFLLPGENARRRVVFCGTEAGAGCSWVCARVAEILASQVRGTVCVIDCNLRSPGLHNQFGVPNNLGLSDALTGSGSVRRYATPLARTNLFLVSSGSSTEDWQSSLASERMRSCIAELRNAFDYLLMDAAPLNVCNDAIALGTQADGVALVLQANASRRETARKALQELKAGNVVALGAVLNRRTYPIPEAIYNRF